MKVKELIWKNLGRKPCSSTKMATCSLSIRMHYGRNERCGAEMYTTRGKDGIFRIVRLKHKISLRELNKFIII